MFQTREARLLRRKLFFLHGTVLLFLCLALATGIAVPLYNYLTEQMIREFSSGVRRQSTAISQYILRAEEMAAQITSRTRLRQELERFNKGETTFEHLVKFSIPKLEDALHRSEEVMGITRLDQKGIVVVSLGIRPPEKAVSGEVLPKNGAGLGGEFKSEGRDYIWVRAPILDRKGRKVGADIVVFSTVKLEEIVRAGSGEGDAPGLWGTLLFVPGQKLFSHIREASSYKSALGESQTVRELIEKAVKAGARKNVVSFGYNNLYCVAAPVEGSEWILAGCLDLDKVDEPVIRRAGLALLLAFCIYLLCLLFYWLALKPLSEKLLLQQDELEREIGAKTQSLESELMARKQVENQLAGEQKRMALILEGTNTGTWEWNIQTGEVTIDRRWAELTGYNIEDISPVSLKTWEELCHPEDHTEATRQLQRHFRGETEFYQAEIRMRHKEGYWVWILDRGRVASRDENGQPLLMSGTHQDITERKHAEQKLKESEERLRTLINSTPDIIVFKDGDGNWLEANNASIELFALEGVEYRGKGDLELAALTDPIYRQAFAVCHDNDEKAWQTGGMVRTEEAVTTIDGSVRIYDFLKVPLFEEDGVRKGVIVLGRDVTQRRIAEEANLRLEGQLRQAHKMQAVGTLAGGIAHDFNNILAAIMGYAEMALTEAGKGRPASMELGQIMKASERARMLVRQILTFSRKMGSEKKTLDLNRLVDESVAVIRRTIPKMIETKVEPGENLPPVTGDPAQIQSVLLNLATNARDAMPDGGRLVIKTGMAEVRQAVCNGCGRIFSGRYVEITVSDNGQGMDRKTISQMFDPFFTTKEVGKGTGLGMATVFGILREHEGHVVCESTPGEGTTFHIYLPPEEAAEPEGGETEPAKPEEPGNGEKILVVDDEEQIRDMTKSYLEQNGYEVLTANDGEQALDIYRRRKEVIDLIILDISMPGMGGRQCMAELLKMDPKVKVLLASGYALGGESGGEPIPGASGYLAKPYRISKLLDMIKKLLTE